MKTVDIVKFETGHYAVRCIKKTWYSTEVLYLNASSYKWENSKHPSLSSHCFSMDLIAIKRACVEWKCSRYF